MFQVSNYLEFMFKELVQIYQDLIKKIDFSYYLK
jgi:hypothetical protein